MILPCNCDTCRGGGANLRQNWIDLSPVPYNELTTKIVMCYNCRKKKTIKNGMMVNPQIIFEKPP